MRSTPSGHIHITGPARSGTTLMMELMRSCYDWDWAPDTESSSWDLLGHHPGRCLTKHPGATKLAELTLRRRNGWVIYCLRDPRDIVCSRHAMAPSRYFSDLEGWEIARQGYLKLRDHPHVVTVRYEDLVTDSDRVQDEIESRIDWLVRRGRFTEFHRLSQPSHESLRAMHGLRPIESSSIGQWRQHLPRLAAELAKHGDISSQLIDEGYEQDDEWLKILDGVEPEPTVSVLHSLRKRRAARPLRRLKRQLGFRLLALKYRLFRD